MTKLFNLLYKSAYPVTSKHALTVLLHCTLHDTVQNISGTPDFVIVIFFIDYLFHRLQKYFIFIFFSILRLHRLLPETVKRPVISASHTAQYMQIY